MALLGTLLLAGCEGGGGSNVLDPFEYVPSFERGSVEGSLDGQDFEMRSAISTRFGPDEGSRSAAILLSNKPNLCEMLENNEQPASARYLLIQAWDWENNQSAVPTDPGTWPIFQNPNYEPKQAFVSFLWSEPDCDFWLAEATGGSLELTTVEPALFGGTATFTTEDGDSAVATFDPEYCDAIPVLLDGPTCVP
jgi:hypothetical protein